MQDKGRKRKKVKSSKHFCKETARHIDDNNFLIEIKNRNQDALCYIIEKYGGLVRSIIRKHLYLLVEEQEECFDDVFLNVWEHIDSFSERRNSFKNWIAGIARYKSIDYLRRYRKQIEDVALPEDIAKEEQVYCGRQTGERILRL